MVVKDVSAIFHMKEVYEKQVAQLKEDWKNGISGHCESTYKIQLDIWKKRINEYEIILDKNQYKGEKESK